MTTSAITLLLVAALIALAVWSLARKKRTPAPTPTSDYMPEAPAALRTDLLYGYYLTFRDQAAETRDHVNIVHESNWFGVDSTIASMRAHGLPVLLDLGAIVYSQGNRKEPLLDLEVRLAAHLEALREAGVLHQVVAMYPMDEPETVHLSDETVTAVNASIRRVAAAFPEVAGKPLAVIYGANDRYPGLASYDWIGLDEYGAGSGVLAGDRWRDLVARLRPDQRTIIVPGGASPWKQEPESFRRYAHATPQVVMVMPFLWAHPEPGEEASGIGRNGMASVYRELGSALAGKGTS